MKRTLMAVAALLVVAAPATAAITGTAHDLATEIGAPDSRICVACHVPHNASPDVPLWNHSLSSQSYTVYTSATLDGTVAAFTGADGSISSICLSCHDGSVALGALVNDPGVTDSTSTIGAVDANLGTDLTNDHPVNFSYQSSLDGGDTELEPIANVTVPLFGAGANEVQCASCHDVHDNTNAPFLVIANTGSALCLECHIK